MNSICKGSLFLVVLARETALLKVGWKGVSKKAETPYGWG